MKLPWSRIAVASLLLIAAFFAWRFLFPSPESLIRKQLKKLARIATFENEGPLAKAYNARALAEFFSTNIEVAVDIPGASTENLAGRQDIQQAAFIAREHFHSMKVEFVDVQISLGPGPDIALAHLTAKVTLPGESNFSPAELNFRFRKENGSWLIYRVEPVKTLSKIPWEYRRPRRQLARA
jgi:hypothetical protein